MRKKFFLAVFFILVVIFLASCGISSKKTETTIDINFLEEGYMKLAISEKDVRVFFVPEFEFKKNQIIVITDLYGSHFEWNCSDYIGEDYETLKYVLLNIELKCKKTAEN